jgi:hypothetical protein
MVRPSPDAGGPEASERLSHVHVVGLELEQLRQRLWRGLEAATTVEAHRVPRRRRRHDHLLVAGVASDSIQLTAETAADTSRTLRAADVDEGELRDRGPQMRHNDGDSDQPLACEGSERDTTGVDEVLELPTPCCDRVVAVAVWVPARRVPIAMPLDEVSPTLLVENLDLLSAIDLVNARQLRASELTDLDEFIHDARIAPSRTGAIDRARTWSGTGHWRLSLPGGPGQVACFAQPRSPDALEPMSSWRGRRLTR